MSRSARRLAVFGLAGTLLAVWAWNDGTKVVPGSPSGEPAAREAQPTDADAGDVQLAASARRIAPPARGTAAPTDSGVEPGVNMDVHGRVLDETGRPVAGAQIWEGWAVDARTPFVATAGDGSFTLRVGSDDCV